MVNVTFYSYDDGGIMSMEVELVVGDRKFMLTRDIFGNDRLFEEIGEDEWRKHGDRDDIGFWGNRNS